MKRFLYSLFALANLGASQVFAADNWIGVDSNKLRTGDV